MENALTETTTIYFGYGSNLWQDQMATRCPNSTYLGIARLKTYRWIINERGYANIVKAQNETLEEVTSQHDYTNEVWGMAYSLPPSDERRLDINEGVPKAYQKQTLECDFWSAKHAAATIDEPEKTSMLVYISKDFVSPSKPKNEYVYRMNMGVQDALVRGIPTDYVEQVIRVYIPKKDDEA